MSGTRALLSCRLCLSPQPGWVALATQPGLRATQVGSLANQYMPGGWGSRAALLFPQNSASENSHRIPEKRSTQEEWTLQGACSQSLLMSRASAGYFNPSPQWGQGENGNYQAPPSPWRHDLAQPFEMPSNPDSLILPLSFTYFYNWIFWAVKEVVSGQHV